MPLTSASSRVRAYGRGGSKTSIQATGGTITTSGNYTVHTFSTVGSSTFSVTRAAPNAVVEVLVIAGGGGGGWDVGGGGGAGGVVYHPNYTITSGSSYSVSVGGGGSGAYSSGAGYSGSNSSFGTSTVITALGGGGAGGWNASSPRTGGGSGGGTTSNLGDYGVANQTDSGGGIGFGWNGGTGANNTSPNANDYAGASGGGGAGGKGGDGSNTTSWGTTVGAGGHGLEFNITGSSTFYAGGGGASSDSSSYWAYGGQGGGGNGGGRSDCNATYYGGGGGGGGAGGYTVSSGNGGGAGYQGLVVVRYPTVSGVPAADQTPYTIQTSNCQAWFDASQFTANSSTWTDRINGYTMTAGSSNYSKTNGSYRISPTSGSVTFVGSNITALNVGSGGITYECWIYLNVTNFGSWRYIMGKSNFWEANSSGLYINGSGTSIGFHTTATNGVEYALSSVGTGWKHIVGVRNPTTGRQLWINGHLVASDRTIDSISTTSVISFGCDQDRTYDEGTYQLGSCRFYSAALTADDVIRNYMLEKSNYGL